MSDNKKYVQPSPPEDELLPETDAEKIIVGSSTHINQTPAKRELTTLYNIIKTKDNTIKDKDSFIEKLTSKYDSLNVKAMKISGLESDKRYLTFACLGCVFLNSLGQ
jgi:hypothetical protein